MGDPLTIRFALSRRDLYEIIRITAAQRPFRRIALPALALFVFLGHAMDGNYQKGAIWAVLIAALYWGISQFMYLINVYGASNETLLAPQVIELQDDSMVVTSEHSREEFLKPEPSDVKVYTDYLVVTTTTVKLVFLKKSFDDPGGFMVLKNWLTSGVPGRGDAVIR